MLTASLTVFPTQFTFCGNFISLPPRFYHSDCYTNLYMARQLCCRGMCKKLLRPGRQQWNYSKANFPSNLNCGQNAVSEMGPGPMSLYDITRPQWIDNVPRATTATFPNSNVVYQSRYQSLFAYFGIRTFGWGTQCDICGRPFCTTRLQI